MEPMRRILYIVAYRWDPDATEQIRAVYPRHRAHIDQLGRDGRLWLIGTLADTAATPQSSPANGGPAPLGNSAIAVFTDLAAAQQFVTGDPYVRAGLISVDPIQAWTPIDYGTGSDVVEHDKERVRCH
jgi:uncharacterized protein YciI